MDALADRGIPFMMGPNAREDFGRPVRAAFIQDPAGNTIELTDVDPAAQELVPKELVQGALTFGLGGLNLQPMYVCHCRAVSDRVVKAAVAAGDRTVEDLGRLLWGRHRLRRLPPGAREAARLASTASSCRSARQPPR